METIQNKFFDELFLPTWMEVTNFCLLEQDDGSKIGVITRADARKFYNAALELSKYALSEIEARDKRIKELENNVDEGDW